MEHKNLVILKLGGSLITDKRATATAREDVIARLAGELAAVWGEIPEAVVLGHGSGSFGHVAAARYGLRGALRSADDPNADERRSPQPLGASLTQDAAARLHRLIVEALLAAGVPAFSIAPSSAFLADGARIVDGYLEPLFTALREGFLPVLYGDVVVDRSLGASICSTETAVDFLLRRAPERGLRARRLLWLGETDGIYDREGRTIARVDAANYAEVRRVLDSPAGTDVTGGMLLRLETARSQARLGIESLIFDGRRAGALEAALRGREVGGTRVAGELDRPSIDADG